MSGDHVKRLESWFWMATIARKGLGSGAYIQGRGWSGSWGSTLSRPQGFFPASVPHACSRFAQPK